MQRFRIVPRDCDLAPADFEAADISGVLLMMQQAECDSADVYSDRQYQVSLELNPHGVWKIYWNPAARTLALPQYA